MTVYALWNFNAGQASAMFEGALSNVPQAVWNLNTFQHLAGVKGVFSNASYPVFNDYIFHGNAVHPGIVFNDSFSGRNTITSPLNLYRLNSRTFTKSSDFNLHWITARHFPSLL